MCRKAGVHGASAQSERQQKSPRTEVRGLSLTAGDAVTCACPCPLQA